MQGEGLKDTVTCLVTMSLGTNYPLSLALSFLPNSTLPILAVGSTSKSLSLFILSSLSELVNPVTESSDFHQSLSSTSTSTSPSSPLLVTESMNTKATETLSILRTLSLPGHMDWIRSLSFCTYFPSLDLDSQDSKVASVMGLSPGDVLLATGSQDKYIRVWKLAQDHGGKGLFPSPLLQDKGTGLLQPLDVQGLTSEMLEALSSVKLESSEGSNLSTQAHILDFEPSVTGQFSRLRYSFMFEALLMGHDDMVFSVEWKPLQFQGGDSFTLDIPHWHQPLTLLSASSDKSMITWSPTPPSGTWVTNLRVGEMGGDSTGLGFYQCHWSSCGNWIFGHDYHGSWHGWKREKMEGSSENSLETWIPQLLPSGHSGPVKDLSWDSEGRFLITCGLDQTTRVFVPWTRDDQNLDLSTAQSTIVSTNPIKTSTTPITSWHEIARPQIHGYDLQTLTALPNSNEFVSGADEKVMRVFQAPSSFLKSVTYLSKLSSMKSLTESQFSVTLMGANLPALGLSNKAVFNEGQPLEFNSGKTCSMAGGEGLGEFYRAPPTESHLMQHTLWPEIDKL